LNVKPGMRLSSQVCETEMVVVKGGGDHTVECGGVPVVPVNDPAAHHGGLSEEFAGGTLLGKRYIDSDETVEILCTKSGAGSLSFDSQLLILKESKPLPSSD
jgi:hypothetical protein